MAILAPKCPKNQLKGSNNSLTCLSAWILLKKCEKRISVSVPNSVLQSVSVSQSWTQNVFKILFTFRYRIRYRDYFCNLFTFRFRNRHWSRYRFQSVLHQYRYRYRYRYRKTFCNLFYIRIKIWSNGRPIHYDPVSMGWGYRNKRQKQSKLITFQLNSYLFSSNLFLYWLISSFWWWILIIFWSFIMFPDRDDNFHA